MNEKWFPKYDPNSIKNKNEWVEEVKKELLDNFIELRKIGENNSYISKLIREDLVEDFIIYVNKNCIQLNSKINQSIYETYSFLIKNKIKLIKYVELTSSLWLNAIHCRNAELIHLLEENDVLLLRR